MDDKKFCFISCVSNERIYEECTFYISHLRIPNGYTAEMLPIRDASGVASAYNKAMNATDAAIKIYLHQDCFIINPNFLNDILKIFAMNESIGMIGMLGAPEISPDGVPENATRVGAVYTPDQEEGNYQTYEYRPMDGLFSCEYVSGMLMVTNRDIPWREDLFDGWDFYDASQCMEFLRKGLKVVVPGQTLAWCAHEGHVSNRWAYDRYRKIFIKEYLG